MSASTSLVTIKTIHTVVWAVLASCILAIPAFGWIEMYQVVVWLTVIVVLEILVIALNSWRYPLTRVAARYTDDRRHNFDIYLPAWLAQHNKLIFGSIFVAGQAIVFLRWQGWIG
jgi:hypothetical protein